METSEVEEVQAEVAGDDDDEEENDPDGILKRNRNWSVKTQTTDIDPSRRGKKYLKKRL